MNKKIVELFVKNGFTPQLENGIMYFTIPLSNFEKDKCREIHGKNHFTPNGNRGVYVANGNIYKYVTSNIKGNWRKYRGRNIYEKDCLNIFAYGGKTRLENVKMWLDMYKNNLYNSTKK